MIGRFHLEVFWLAVSAGVSGFVKLQSLSRTKLKCKIAGSHTSKSPQKSSGYQSKLISAFLINHLFMKYK